MTPEQRSSSPGAGTSSVGASRTAPGAGEGGLGPFDVPRFLDEPRERRPGIAAVAGGVVARFIVRSAVLCVLVTSAPFLDGDDHRVALLSIVAVVLPAVTVLDRLRVDGRFAALGVGGTAADLVIIAIDAATIVVFARLVESIEVAVAVGIATIAFHRHTSNRAGGVASVSIVAAGTAWLTAIGLPGSTWLDPILVLAVGATLVTLVGSQATAREHTSAGLRLASDKAAAVLAGIGDAIVLTDASGRVREANPAADRLLGQAQADVGPHCHDRLGLQSDRGPLSCRDECALLACDGPVEVWRIGPKGERQPLLANAVALHDRRGDLVETVHSLRDITSVKAADEAKSLFLSTASHELKTPLAVIRGFAQLLQTTELDRATHAAAVETIERRSAELADIVDRLLMSSRIDSGRIDLHPSLYPLDELVRRRVDEFRASSGIDVAVQTDPGTPSAWCDPAALITVIDHLLDNARKYAPVDPDLRVTVRDGADTVDVIVSDNGVGMDEEEIRRCFDHFWQAEGTDVRRFGGTGVGLYIVRSLVLAMDATIEVDSRPGAGAAFTVRLRCSPPPAVEAIGAATRTRSVDGESSMIREFMRQVGVLESDGVAR